MENNIKCGDKVKIIRFGRVSEHVYTVRAVYGKYGSITSYQLSNGNFFKSCEIVKA